MVFLLKKKGKKEKYWLAFQILLSHKKNTHTHTQIPKKELKKEKYNKLRVVAQLGCNHLLSIEKKKKNEYYQLNRRKRGKMVGIRTIFPYKDI